MKPTETQIVAVCIKYLNLRGHFVWRNNSGFDVRYYKNKLGVVNKRVLRTGLVGSSDIIGIAKDGRMIAVECKRPGNTPTDAQKAFLLEISIRGGYTVVAYGIEQLQFVGL